MIIAALLLLILIGLILFYESRTNITMSMYTCRYILDRILLLRLRSIRLEKTAEHLQSCDYNHQTEGYSDSLFEQPIIYLNEILKSAVTSTYNSSTK